VRARQPANQPSLAIPNGRVHYYSGGVDTSPFGIELATEATGAWLWSVGLACGDGEERMRKV